VDTHTHIMTGTYRLKRQEVGFLVNQSDVLLMLGHIDPELNKNKFERLPTNYMYADQLPTHVFFSPQSSEMLRETPL
jgi:hypothetical protein